MTTCDRASLVEASFDGRLGASEQRAMERHLATCVACTAERRTLQAMRATVRSLPNEITPLEHQRARLALLRRAVTPAKRKARPIALLAVALVFVPALVWAGKSTRVPIEVAPVETMRESAPPLVIVPKPLHHDVVIEAPKAPEPPPAPPPTPTRSRASLQFAEAMDSVAQGDFGAGAARLDRFAQENPHDPRAEEALYLEAIAFERAGRTSDSAAAAHRYLAAYPNGAHRTHAQRLAGVENENIP